MGIYLQKHFDLHLVSLGTQRRGWVGVILLCKATNLVFTWHTYSVDTGEYIVLTSESDAYSVGTYNAKTGEYIVFLLIIWLDDL